MESFLQPMMTKGLLVGARVSMLMVFAPFFGSTAIPVRLKTGLTLALAVLLYPSLPASSQDVFSMFPSISGRMPLPVSENSINTYTPGLASGWSAT